MKETGYIISIKNDTAAVEVHPHEACSKCCSCGAGKKRQVVVISPNVAVMNIGQEVIVEIEDKLMFKVYLMLYGLPLVAFLAGLLLTYVFIQHPLISFGAGFCCMLIAFVIVGRFIKNNTAYSPSIRAV